MTKNTIRFSILKTSVRGKKKENYNLLMEENDRTIIFYPLTINDEVFEDLYKNIPDVINKIVWLDETYGYFNKIYDNNPDQNLVDLMNGVLKINDIPNYIELEGFEGLY